MDVLVSGEFCALVPFLAVDTILKLSVIVSDY